MLDIKTKLTSETLAWVRESPATVKAALVPAMKTCLALAEATSKKDYLSGPRPGRLDRVTGRLRGSVTTEASASGNTIVGKIGTNVIYGRAHELGFRGNVTVSAHTRRTAGGSANVRSHTRKMDIKARPFLRPALEDNLDRFCDIFADAVVKAFLEA